jgi:peptide/nickel transport system substrate-binding protein
LPLADPPPNLGDKTNGGAKKMSLPRRKVLAGTVAALAAPSLAGAQNRRLLKFIPQADLAVLDPVWAAFYVVGAHGMMIFDTLYGMDSEYRPQPQMAEGHRIDDNGKTWSIDLRPGLAWHDGEPVLARDCVASIRRWGVRDSFGQTLMAAVDGIDAPDDRTIRFRLKRPFPLLAAALGKTGPNICVMMPERLANTDPFKQVTEMVGSGPFRFVAKDRVAGSMLAYERNEAYVPRPNGTPSVTAGPKIVNFDRVEWHILPDAASSAAAMRTGEFDWWENPSFDLLPMLRSGSNLTVARINPFGSMAGMRLNHLHPPFDNPALRRALLGAIQQEDFLSAVATTDRTNWTAGVGYFCPISASANSAGMEALTAPRDIEAVKRAVAASGYRGEPIVIPVPGEYASFSALGNVGVDLLRKIGLTVDMRSTDWGSMQRTLASTEPPDKGGWSAYFAHPSGLDMFDPATHYWLRGNGRAAARGWPSSPRIESLRDEWLIATDPAAKKQIAEAMQRQAFIDVPYIPLGQTLGSTVYQKTLTGVLSGAGPLFWNVRRAA